MKEIKLSNKQIYSAFKEWFYEFIAEQGSEPSEQYEDEALKGFQKVVRHYKKTHIL